MKKIIFLLCILSSFAACHDDDDPEPEVPGLPGQPKEARGNFDRTVLVYVAGENNLSYFIDSELQEMRQGSKEIGNNALLVFIDDSDDTHMPYMLWIKDGMTADSISLVSDPLTSDPETMSTILNLASTYYPAKEYGIVLWGHSSGWIFSDSIAAGTTAKAPRRAYGIDTGSNSSGSAGKWMNMPTLSKTLKEWRHLKFIFEDCFQFQCVESAYELREAADYIIGSPAEVPGQGAPYHTVVPALFEQSATFYEAIVDRYFEQVIPVNPNNDGLGSTLNARTPLSVIKTSALPHLAEATNKVLHSFLPLADNALPDMSQLIYYRGNISAKRKSMINKDVMYDMNDFILHYANDEAYDEWKRAFDEAVVCKRNTRNGWMTDGQVNGLSFKWLTDVRYGGVSMFVPQEREGSEYSPYTSQNVQHDGYNAEIKKTSWYGAARLAEFGW